MGIRIVTLLLEVLKEKLFMIELKTEGQSPDWTSVLVSGSLGQVT